MSSATKVTLFCISGLLRADVGTVRLCVGSMRWIVLRWLAIVASWLGNGWIYIGIVIAALFAMGTEAFEFIWKSCASVIILHLIYRPLKVHLSRPRPFHIFPELKPLLPVLDEFSFPSGHAMTLTAVLVTLPVTSISATLALIGVWITMAWARIAVAHHYLSDVLAGSVMAILVAYPISMI